jgi:hypothetical protein
VHQSLYHATFYRSFHHECVLGQRSTSIPADGKRSSSQNAREICMPIRMLDSGRNHLKFFFAMTGILEPRNAGLSRNIRVNVNDVLDVRVWKHRSSYRVAQMLAATTRSRRLIKSKYPFQLRRSSPHFLTWSYFAWECFPGLASLQIFYSPIGPQL